MYHAGARQLLSFGAILETEVNIVSFGAFILADLSNRASFVQKIEVIFPFYWGWSLNTSDRLSVDAEPIALACLANVLRNATNLHTFRIDASQELLERSPDLILAIKEHQSLCSFKLGYCGKFTPELLHGMRSFPIEIDLDCRNLEPYPSNLVHPLRMIGKHCATVVKFSTRFADIYEIQEEVQLRSIRALALRDCWFIDWRALNHEFGYQGIEYLEIDTGEVRNHRHVEVDEETASGAVWKDVKYLCGNLEALVLLPLKHSIKRLDIDRIGSHSHCLQQISTLLAKCMPQRYVVCPGDDWTGAFDVKKLPFLLPMPQGSQTTHFVLDADVAALHGSGEILIVRCSFYSVTSQLSLTCARSLTEKLEATAFKHSSDPLYFPTKQRKNTLFPACTRSGRQLQGAKKYLGRVCTYHARRHRLADC